MADCGNAAQPLKKNDLEKSLCVLLVYCSVVKKKKTNKHNIVYSLIALILKNMSDTQVCTCIRRPGNLFQTIDSGFLLGRSGRGTVKSGTSVSSLFAFFDLFLQ